MSMKTNEHIMTTQFARSDDAEAAGYFGAAGATMSSATETDIPPSRVGALFSDDNWALEKCGFKRGRAILDPRSDEEDLRPIAVVDVGYGALDHPSIAPVITERLQRNPNSSSAVHAAEVTGVIVSACPARVDVYNVATTAGLDSGLVLQALAMVRKSRARVLNLSIGWHERDRQLNDAITDCLADGIVVIAAMGEYEEPNNVISYPAAIPGVIAVGATDRHDRRLPGSGVGEHIWIAAPGEDIPTTTATNAIGLRQGTSFATALVSAAAWLVVRAQPSWRPNRVREALGDSADSTLVGLATPKMRKHAPSNEKWNVAVGCGRLDVAAALSARV